jgi:putative membrane protein
VVFSGIISGTNHQKEAVTVLNLILRIVINAVALWVADLVVPGLTVSDNFGALFLVAIVFGLVNAFIKPIVQFLSCPITILTLGLFTLIINTAMLSLTGWLTGGRLSVDSFWAAFFGAIIISIVSTVLSWFLPDKN